jgi:glucose-6-phosphate isomerase
MEIEQANTFFDGGRGILWGDGIIHSERRLKDMKGIFRDENARSSMDGETLVYRVEMHKVVDNIPGGLLFGVSRIYPGEVGNEYFMTNGHFHAVRDRAEYYWGISGEGILLLMDKENQIRAEVICPGSLHYIPGHIAHRLINTGNMELAVGACWPSDAGHDYASIFEKGFSARVIKKEGKPSVIPD